MVLRVGILGAAGIASASLIAPASRRVDVRVVAVAARDRKRSEAFARQHNIARSYGSYTELLADPRVDLVYVALPPSLHAEWSIAALEAGKHVLCEKPFAMSAAEAELMAAAAARAERRLIEAFHDDYHPLAARISELSTSLGPLSAVEGVFLVRNPFEAAHYGTSHPLAAGP